MRLKQEVLKSRKIHWRKIKEIADEIKLPEKSVYKGIYDYRVCLENNERRYRDQLKKNHGKIFELTNVEHVPFQSAEAPKPKRKTKTVHPSKRKRFL